MKRASLSAMAVAILSFTLVHATKADASAWTMPKGKGQLLITGVYSHSDRGFDADGKTTDIPDYDKQELYLLGEYGVTDDLTLIAAPSFRHVGIQGNGDDTTGLGYTEVGARYRMAGGVHWVGSLQATARIPGARRRDALAQVGSTDAEYDVRALGGASFSLGHLPGFVNLEGGYRVREGDPPNEFRADATLGIRPAKRVLLYTLWSNSWSDGAGRGVFKAYRYHNAFLNAAYDLSDRWSLQVGGLATVGGKNALRERGATGGVWFRF
ncbi:hypothetical protein [Sphingomonas sp.]|uniref:hypothetical protein n=1 Tax=Sphingomonas sp. TaxID=28214 RepID=UPI0031E08A0B